jgi:hypothetical protein
MRIPRPQTPLEEPVVGPVEYSHPRARSERERFERGVHSQITKAQLGAKSIIRERRRFEPGIPLKT